MLYTFLAEAIESQSPPLLETSISLQENEVWKAWHSPEGLLRLQKHAAKENFWKLLRFYESQTCLTYCGIATAVIALNALSIEAPPSTVLGKYRMFTQENFFSENVSPIISQNKVLKEGISLEELATVLRSFSLKVFKYEANTLSCEEIRTLILSALESPQQCVLALYGRNKLKQEGEGHWSPIAAYDKESDSFLLLDVAKFKYPPAWINLLPFIDAMQTPSCSGQSRGFIIIEKE